VCLGAQLLAAATGGSVVRGRVGPELGLCRIYLDGSRTATDPLLHGLPIANAVQWHWDEVLALPPGATLLARGATYPHQAFRVGEHAWGLQFHPEARASMVRRWAVEDGQDTAHADDVARAWPDLEHTWATVAQRFADVVQDVAVKASNTSNGPR
jgi:GMP synthase (glutamine-hydrolysing)